MDADAKKTALRMIPYGLYVLTAENNGEIAAATVNWVTQCSFQPPLSSLAFAPKRSKQGKFLSS